MEGPFGGTSGQPCLTLHATRRLPPWRGLPNKGGRSGPEPRSPRPTPSPCPRCLWSLPAPTRLHRFLPGRRAQGTAVRAGKPGGRHPPPLTRRSPVAPRPATYLAATHLLSRPICSQGSHQSHFTKATLLTGHLPSAGHYPQHQTNQFCPASSAPLLAAQGQCVVSPGRYSQPSMDWHQGQTLQLL